MDQPKAQRPFSVNKPMVKRSGLSPWKTAEGSLIKPHTRAAVDPKPARVTSDITKPSPAAEKPVAGKAVIQKPAAEKRAAEKSPAVTKMPITDKPVGEKTAVEKPVQQKARSVLSSNPRMTELQRQWEKQKAAVPVGGSSTKAGRTKRFQIPNTSSSSEDEDDDTDSDSDSDPEPNAIPVPRASAKVTPVSKQSEPESRSSTHVPLPSYAFANPKRSGSDENDSQPLPKRRSASHRSLLLKRAKEMAEMEASRPLALLRSEQPRASSNAESSGNVSDATRSDNWIEVDGRMVEVIPFSSDGRPYKEFRTPEGKLRSACGGLIPNGYEPDDLHPLPWICPVRDCRKFLPALQAFGSHFSAAHNKRAWNDNGDATLSLVGTYKSSGKSSPGVIISTNPLPPGAPPPVEPSYPAATSRYENIPATNATAAAATATVDDDDDEDRPVTEGRPRRKRRRTQQKIDWDGDTMIDLEEPFDDPVVYLHNHLSPIQPKYRRADIDHFSKLPRLRDLPEAWLTFHHLKLIDTTHYACALAFIVGEVVTVGACTVHNTTSRLSSQCIKLPTGMPAIAKEAFSSTLTCVGCRYWQHLQRQKSSCDWYQPPPTFKSLEDKEARGETSTSDDAKPAPRSASHVPAKKATKKYKRPATVAMEPSDQESERHVRDPPAARRKASPRVQPQAVTETPIIRQGEMDDANAKMEDWEFAPGRKVDESSNETVAFSSVYLTGTQPVTIADDISFNRLRIPPGGTHHWMAENNKLRYCEVITGKVELKVGESTLTLGPGGLFVVRPGMSCIAENRRYVEAVLSCNTIANYTLI